jgi:hypothetical protein
VFQSTAQSPAFLFVGLVAPLGAANTRKPIMSKKLIRGLLLAFAAYALSAGCVTATTAIANAAVFPSGSSR